MQAEEEGSALRYPSVQTESRQEFVLLSHLHLCKNMGYQRINYLEQDHDAVHKDEGFIQFYILHWKTEYPTPSEGDTTQIKVKLDEDDDDEDNNKRDEKTRKKA